MNGSWEVQYRKGVWLPQIGWWLDGQARAPRAFVSHAHGDHIARHEEVVCTRATARFLQARLPGRRKVTELPFGLRHALEFGLHATLHPAGHILGSAQILLEHEDRGSLLYTGISSCAGVSPPRLARRRGPTCS
jgi:mRNA degradation ribonuclease J1/J2